MTVVYRDYARAKTGVVLGMAGWQLGIVVLAGLPILVPCKPGTGQAW